MDETFEAASRLIAIDTKMTGRLRVTSAYLVQARAPALVETGTSTSAPGRAAHQVWLVDSACGALSTRDSFGLAFPDVGVLRRATPPPDIDVELAVESIDRIRARAESVVMFRRFGPVREVDELCGV